MMIFRSNLSVQQNVTDVCSQKNTVTHRWVCFMPLSAFICRERTKLPGKMNTLQEQIRWFRYVKFRDYLLLWDYEDYMKSWIYFSDAMCEMFLEETDSVLHTWLKKHHQRYQWVTVIYMPPKNYCRVVGGKIFI